MRHSNYPIVFAGLIAAVAFGLATPAAQADPTAVTGASASVTITSPAPVTMLFPFARTGDTGFLAWIHYHTVDGTAVAGTDYTAAAGQLQMPAGAATAGLPVTILGKNANSPDKAFSLALDSIVGTGPLPSFATHPDFPAGSTPFSVTAADVNGDGRPDLIVANNGGAGTVSVFLNTTTPGAAAPSFATHVDFPAGVEPTSATAA
ncbi:MAG: FG-GAP-like repeat-containing protein, partial [Gammaproteobacteria bacterium]